MMRNIARCLVCCTVLSCTQGCTELSESGYSSRYVAMKQAGDGLQYLPKACLAEDVTGIEKRLPPGCANALNLAEMLVRQEDLGHGREMGPALSAPAANAIERYLNVGRDDDKLRKERLVREAATAG